MYEDTSFFYKFHTTLDQFQKCLLCFLLAEHPKCIYHHMSFNLETFAHLGINFFLYISKRQQYTLYLYVHAHLMRKGMHEYGMHDYVCLRLCKHLYICVSVRTYKRAINAW